MACRYPRYLARTELYNRRRPERDAAIIDLVGGLVEAQTAVRPAYRDGIRTVDLGTTEDGHKRVAVTAGYRVKYIETRPNMFLQLPSPQEKVIRDTQRNLLQLKLEEEEDKDEKEQDPELIGSLKAQIRQLSNIGHGYLETAYNAIGKNTVSLWYGLRVPNIPVVLKGLFKIKKNRAFSFRLQRAQAAEGQANHEFTIEFGNGTTLYAIVIGSDGNSSEFQHFRNMKPAERTRLLDRRDALLDQGRLTPEEQLLITERLKEEAAIRNAAKGSALTDEQNLRIQQLHKANEELQNSKKLSRAQQKQLAELDKELFLEKQTFRLQEDAEDLIGQPIDVTVQFLRSGHLIVRSKDSEFIYENKRLTGWRPAGYHDQLPDGSSIALRSNGGQWAFMFGYPEFPAEAVFATSDFEMEFEPSAEDLYVYDDSDNNGDENEIRYDINVLQRPEVDRRGRHIPGRFQVVTTILTDTESTPELYRAQLHIPASNAPPRELVWSSQTDGARDNEPGNSIMDVSLQDDSERSRLVEVTIATPAALMDREPPRVAGGLCADVWVYDKWEEQDTYILKSGRVIENSMTHVNKLALRDATGCGSVRTLRAAGTESFADTEITALLVGDTLPLNEYLRLLAHDAGLYPEEYSGIPEGDAGLPTLPRSVPSQPPAIAPSVGTNYWTWMQEIVQKHGYGWNLFYDGEKICLERDGARDHTDSVNYAFPPEADSDSPYAIHNARQDGVTLRQNLDGHVTRVIITGAQDHLTGKRYSHTDSHPAANDERFRNSLFYTGQELTEYAAVDDGLTSPQACQLAARRALSITPSTPLGLTPWYVDLRVKLGFERRAGDVVRVMGKRAVLRSVEYGSINSSKEDLEKMNITLQLAEDWDTNDEQTG